MSLCTSLIAIKRQGICLASKHRWLTIQSGEVLQIEKKDLSEINNCSNIRINLSSETLKIKILNTDVYLFEVLCISVIKPLFALLVRRDMKHTLKSHINMLFS